MHGRAGENMRLTNNALITPEQKENIRYKVRIRIQQRLKDDYCQFQHEWIKEIKSNFISFCQDIQSQQLLGNKAEIHYILYSLLRTGLLDHHSTYLIQATDEHSVFDRNSLEYEYDGHCLYNYWNILIEELVVEAKNSGWNISETEMDSVRLEEAEYFHYAMIPLLRKAVRQAVQLPEYTNLLRASQVEIRAGEYLDQSICIYKEDRNELDQMAIHQWISEKTPHTYGYQNIHDITLSWIEAMHQDFRYTTFQRVQVELSRLDFSILTGTQWQDCKIQKSALLFSLLHGADFSGCTLQYVVMDGVMGASGIEELDWEPLGYDGVDFSSSQFLQCWLRESKLQGASFRSSCMDQVDFSKASLRGADFSESNLSNTVFQDTDLRDACFDHSQLSSISFAGANLQGASFAGAILENTDFTGALLSIEQLDRQQRRDAYGINITGGRLQ